MTRRIVASTGLPLGLGSNSDASCQAAARRDGQRAWGEIEAVGAPSSTEWWGARAGDLVAERAGSLWPAEVGIGP